MAKSDAMKKMENALAQPPYVRDWAKEMNADVDVSSSVSVSSTSESSESSESSTSSESSESSVSVP